MLTAAEALDAFVAQGHDPNDVEVVLDRFLTGQGRVAQPHDTAAPRLSAHDLRVLAERLRYAADEEHLIPAWAAYSNPDA